MALTHWLAIGIAGALVAANSASATDTLDKIAVVEHIDELAMASCVPGASSHHDPDSFWNLRKDESEFKFLKRGSVPYAIDPITPEVDRSIKDPLFYPLNPGADWIDAAPCTTTSLKDKRLFFALHKIPEPGNPYSEGWHAIFFVPVKPSSGPEWFYLFVLGIKDDSSKCVQNDGSVNARCKELRDLAIMKMENVTMAEISRKLNDKLDVFLPPSGSAHKSTKGKQVTDSDDTAKAKYHNGVIHGPLN